MVLYIPFYVWLVDFFSIFSQLSILNYLVVVFNDLAVVLFSLNNRVCFTSFKSEIILILTIWRKTSRLKDTSSVSGE